MTKTKQKKSRKRMTDEELTAKIRRELMSTGRSHTVHTIEDARAAAKALSDYHGGVEVVLYEIPPTPCFYATLAPDGPDDARDMARERFKSTADYDGGEH